MDRSTSRWLILAVGAVALAALGYWLLFSNLALYDDEGYVLISAREFQRHGRLYDAVYSQYGPAFYALLEFFQRVTGLVDHTSGRWLTLAFWLGGAACCAALVQRTTSSLRLAGFTFAATFLFLYFLVDEPFHPGASIVFILACSLLGMTACIAADQWTKAVIIAGGTTAILTLTKINVGVFYFASMVAWGALHAASEKGQRTARLLAGAGLTLFAAGVMHTLWREAWVQIYLVQFAVGAMTLVAVVPGERRVTPRHALLFAGTGAVVTVVILLVIWLRGTSLSGLLDGVLLGPLRHPSSYSYPVDWRPGSLAVAALSALLAGAWPYLRRKFSDKVTDRIVVGARLIQTAALVFGLATLMQYRVIGAVFSYVAPSIWIWVVPLRGANLPSSLRSARTLIGAVLLLQFLHAYPVGGIQESWGTFLFLPLVALGLGEIREWSGARRWWPALASAILAVLVVKVAWAGVAARATYGARRDLALPGAEQLRLPEGVSTAYRILALNAAVHGDLLFSLPGMFSFNLWTGLPPPTGKNTTLWFTLLNEPEQRAIIAALQKSSRSCVIIQESLVELTRHSGVVIGGVLCDYLAANFTPVFRTEGFAFCVQTGRSVAALNVAQLSLSSAAGHPGAQFDLCLASDGTPIAAIEVHDFAAPSRSPVVFDGRNARVSLAAIDRTGRAAQPLAPATWPLRFTGLARVSIEVDRGAAALSRATTVLYLKGAHGEILGEIRLAE